MKMRKFYYEQTAKDLMTPQTANKLCNLYECRGAAEMLTAGNHEILDKMHASARAYNVAAASRLSGIHVPARRMHALLDCGAEPDGQDEQELLGYHRACNYIHDHHAAMPRSVDTILFLHRMLFEKSDPENAGKWKCGTFKVDKHGRQILDFTGVSPEETPAYMEEIIKAYHNAYNKDDMITLLLFPILILDIINIRPFDRGNRRISKLMALLAIYNAGHDLGKYVSMSSILERTKESGDKAIKQSSAGWAEGANDYMPYCMYVLSVVETACKEFKEDALRFLTEGMTKHDRIRMVLESQTGEITKADLLELCPDVSVITIQRALSDFTKEGIIKKLRDGRYSAYIYVGGSSGSTPTEAEKSSCT